MGGHQGSVSTALRMAVLELANKLNLSHPGETNRRKCTHDPHTEIHTVYVFQRTCAPHRIWQLKSISCKHVESVCWAEGVSVGSQPAMWRNSLMKSVCACLCAWNLTCKCLNILVFSQFDTLAGLFMASRSRATSVGAKTVKVPLSVLGTTAGIQTSVTFV